jgi:hypothetical protein
LSLLIDQDKSPARFQRFSEKDFEYIFLVAVALWMVFPDERVRCNDKEIGPIFRPERPKLDKFVF